MNKKQTLLCTAAISAIGVGIVIVALHKTTSLSSHYRKPVADSLKRVPKPVVADKLYASNPRVAKKEYETFVATYAASANPVVQDQVGTARIKVGYLTAHQRDWKAARKAFLAADTQTKGTNRTGDFGTVNDQGAYEAIVCLEASGNKSEARKEYLHFIEARPLSPLCMACYRRIKRLDGGRTTDALDGLIQSATQRQDANASFESSVCGPRTIAYLCEIGAIDPGARPHDYKAIAKLCRTTNTGTSITGMVAGLKSLGVRARAFRVCRQDLGKVKAPAILLWGDHYLTLLEVEDNSIRAYDTLTRSERTFAIPASDNPDFFVDAILLNSSL